MATKICGHCQRAYRRENPRRCYVGGCVLCYKCNWRISECVDVKRANVAFANKRIGILKDVLPPAVIKRVQDRIVQYAPSMVGRTVMNVIEPERAPNVPYDCPCGWSIDVRGNEDVARVIQHKMDRHPD